MKDHPDYVPTIAKLPAKKSRTSSLSTSAPPSKSCKNPSSTEKGKKSLERTERRRKLIDRRINPVPRKKKGRKSKLKSHNRMK